MKFSTWLENRKRLPIVKKKMFIIMRGAPGAGKSRRVRELLIKYGGDENHVFSTDNLWIPETLKKRTAGEDVSEKDELEEYLRNHPDTDKARLAKGHQSILEQVRRTMDNGVSPIILDNTSVMWQFIKSYVNYAKKQGYEIKLEEPTSPWWLAYRPFLKTKNEPKLRELLDILKANNKHKIPEKIIWKMLNQWQEINLDKEK